MSVSYLIPKIGTMGISRRMAMKPPDQIHVSEYGISSVLSLSLSIGYLVLCMKPWFLEVSPVKKILKTNIKAFAIYDCGGSIDKPLS